MASGGSIEVEIVPRLAKKGTLGRVFFLPFDQLWWDDGEHWGQLYPERIAQYRSAYRIGPFGETTPAPFTLAKNGKVAPVEVIAQRSGPTLAGWKVRNGRHRVLAALAAGMSGVWCREFVDRNDAPRKEPASKRWWQRG